MKSAKSTPPTKRTQQRRITCGVFLATSVFVFVCSLPRLFTYILESPFQLTQGMLIAGEVLHGQLKSEQGGRVELPPELQYGNREKKKFVYVTKKSSDLTLIYFPTLENYGSRGYIFCSRPLVSGDFTPQSELNSETKNQSFIDIRTRYNWPGNRLDPYPISENLNDNWYYSTTPVPDK